MTEQPGKEQIIERFRRKMIETLEGSIEIQEVCGLSIESLRANLLAERNRLLKQGDYDESISTRIQGKASPRAQIQEEQR